MNDTIAQATIVAGMWVDGWTGMNKLTIDEVHKAYIPTLPVVEASNLVHDMRTDVTCPLRGADDVPPTWNWRDNHVGLSADAHWVMEYVDAREASLLPTDLERMK